MTATELLNFCRDRDIRLSAGVDGKLQYEAPCGAVDQWLSGELHAHRVELMTLLGGQEPPRRQPVVEEQAVLHPASGGLRPSGLTQGQICPRCKSPDLVVSDNVPAPHHAKLMCVRCARFVAWLPKPVEYDPNWKWPFGKKHKGRGLHEIAAIDPEYLEWVADTWDDEPRIRERVSYFREHMGRMPRSSDSAASQPI